MFKAILDELYLELNSILKYEEFKVYYITATTILGYILLRKFIQGKSYTNSTRCDGKVVVITGGNTGIGKETAVELAKRGAKVYIACRSTARGNDAKEEIIQRSGNHNVLAMKLDLSSFDSIRDFAAKFQKEEKRLDILINNAGVMGLPLTRTKDGLEMQIGVNHFGHFLLTNLLLNMIKKSKPSRIINVSSLAHRFGKIKKDDLNSEKSYSEMHCYSQSKLANVLFTRELAKRLEGTNVTVNALHPGTINTELSRHIGKITILFNKYLVKPCQFLFFKTSKAGAQTTIYAALDPTLDNVTGKYFSECELASIGKHGLDDKMGEWLWEVSEKMTKISAKSN